MLSLLGTITLVLHVASREHLTAYRDAFIDQLMLCFYADILIW